MINNKGLENLEIKLKNAKIENAEKYEKIEKKYNQNYKEFVDSFFKTDVLGIKKIISALFQLESFNGKTGIDSLKIALEKGFEFLPIKYEKREKLKEKIIKLEKNKLDFKEIFIEKSDFSKDKNYPILESLFNAKVLNNSEMLILFSNYEKFKEIRLSLNGLSKEKISIIKKYFYELNSTKKEEKIENFKQYNNDEIKKLEQKYPANIVDGVVKFVGRNFFKMKPYKKNIESKKVILKRTFKIALLKLLRIKYSGFNVEKLIKNIDSMEDFESMFTLLMKLIDIIPENNELLEKFSIKEEVDEVEEIITEAELNKEKILSSEESIIKICEIINSGDKKLDKKVLDKILNEETNIIGEEIIFREKGNKNGTIFSPHSVSPNGREVEQEDEEDEEENIEEIYKELKIEFNLLEKKKQKIFASGDFDELDNINDKILSIMIKIEKIEMILV